MVKGRANDRQPLPFASPADPTARVGDAGPFGDGVDRAGHHYRARLGQHVGVPGFLKGAHGMTGQRGHAGTSMTCVRRGSPQADRPPLLGQFHEHADLRAAGDPHAMTTGRSRVMPICRPFGDRRRWRTPRAPQHVGDHSCAIGRQRSHSGRGCASTSTSLARARSPVCASPREQVEQVVRAPLRHHRRERLRAMARGSPRPPASPISTSRRPCGTRRWSVKFDPVWLVTADLLAASRRRRSGPVRRGSPAGRPPWPPAAGGSRTPTAVRPWAPADPGRPVGKFTLSKRRAEPPSAATRWRPGWSRAREQIVLGRWTPSWRGPRSHARSCSPNLRSVAEAYLVDLPQQLCAAATRLATEGRWPTAHAQELGQQGPAPVLGCWSVSQRDRWPCAARSGNLGGRDEERTDLSYRSRRPDLVDLDLIDAVEIVGRRTGSTHEHWTSSCAHRRSHGCGEASNRRRRARPCPPSSWTCRGDRRRAAATFLRRCASTQPGGPSKVVHDDHTPRTNVDLPASTSLARAARSSARDRTRCPAAGPAWLVAKCNCRTNFRLQRLMAESYARLLRLRGRHAHRSVQRSILRRAALRYADHGWPVFQAHILTGSLRMRPLCPTVGCHPAVDSGTRASTDASTWSCGGRHPFSVLLATGRRSTIECRPVSAWPPPAPPSWPVAVTPVGRWMFLVEPGTRSAPSCRSRWTLSTRRRSWIPARPPGHGDAVSGGGAAAVTDWRLPDPYPVQKACWPTIGRRPTGRPSPDTTPASAAPPTLPRCLQGRHLTVTFD